MFEGERRTEGFGGGRVDDGSSDFRMVVSRDLTVDGYSEVNPWRRLKV